MIFLLDTSAFSDLMREEARTIKHLAAISTFDRVLICSVVRGEILHGIARLPEGKRKERLHDKAGSLFAAVVCEPVAGSAADQYAKIKAACQLSGLNLDDNDLWIAATAMDLDATLISRDSDMTRIAGLKVLDWTA